MSTVSIDCSRCVGTGMGQYDGGKCTRCHGKGSTTVESDDSSWIAFCHGERLHHETGEEHEGGFCAECLLPIEDGDRDVYKDEDMFHGECYRGRYNEDNPTEAR